jgi:hypothetical protein
LDQLIHKVGGFKTPSWGHLVLSDLDLLGENVISDLLSCFAYIGALAVHAFIPDDAHCEVINSDSMILPAHDFGSYGK